MKKQLKENLGKFEERLSSLNSTISSKYKSVVTNMNTYIEFGKRTDTAC